MFLFDFEEKNSITLNLSKTAFVKQLNSMTFHAISFSEQIF